MALPLNVEALRGATPDCVPVAVHFNHAGASLPSRETLEAVVGHLRLEASSGPMEAAALVADRLEEARADAASLLGATAEDIAFASGGSEAWGKAFAALPPLRAGERLLVGRQEWGGNLATLRAAADRVGARIEAVPTDAHGGVDAEALGAMIDARVRLISLTWLPANGGLINDAEAVGRVTRPAGVPYFGAC